MEQSQIFDVGNLLLFELCIETACLTPECRETSSSGARMFHVPVPSPPLLGPGVVDGRSLSPLFA